MGKLLGPLGIDLVNFSDLTLVYVLTEGNFGSVSVTKYYPIIRSSLVVKIFKGSNSTEKQDAFWADLSILNKHVPRHENIINIYHFSLDPICITMEYVAFKFGKKDLISVTNLYQYLLLLRKAFKKRMNDGDSTYLPDLHHDNLNSFPLQIAEGMKYLHQNNIIHGDLTSQNVLLDSNLCIRISDFGFLTLKAHLRETGQSCPISYRWSAPEVILGSQFSKESDVFSYGILLWHIGTLGGLPYSDLCDEEIYQKLTLKPVLPEIPKYFIPKFESFLNCLWSTNPDKRINFSDIPQRLFQEFVPAGCYPDFDSINPDEEFPPIKSRSPVRIEEPCHIDPCRLRCVRLLGEGHFGWVFENLMGFDRVAVKKLKYHPSSGKRQTFVDEINILKKAGRHKNIVQILGYYETHNEKCIVMEYIAFDSNGGNEHTSLYEYLLFLRAEFEFYATREDCSTSPLLNHKELGRFVLQIAAGMAHLEEKGVVHSNLKSKNILLNNNKVIKITDYGLHGRGIFRCENDEAFLYFPRWASPEVIVKGKYSNKSDVWGFAVVLWEIATLGGLPYYELNDDEVTKGVLGGISLTKSRNITDMLWRVMVRCWYFKEYERPSFQELSESCSSNFPRGNDAYLDFDDLPLTFKLPPTDEFTLSQHSEEGYYLNNRMDELDLSAPSKPSSLTIRNKCERPKEHPPPPPSFVDQEDKNPNPSLQYFPSRYRKARKQEEEKKAIEEARSKGAIPRTPPSKSSKQPSSFSSSSTVHTRKLKFDRINVTQLSSNSFRKEETQSSEHTCFPPDVVTTSRIPQYQDLEDENLEFFNVDIKESRRTDLGNEYRCKFCGRHLRPSEFCYCNCDL